MFLRIAEWPDTPPPNSWMMSAAGPSVMGSGSSPPGVTAAAMSRSRDMAALTRYKTDPLDPQFETALSTLAHEMLHQWGAYVRFKKTDGTLNTTQSESAFTAAELLM